MSALRMAALALAPALLLGSCAYRPWNGDETERIGEAMASEPFGEELADGVPVGAMAPMSRAQGRTVSFAGEVAPARKKLKVREAPAPQSPRKKAPRAH